MGVRLTEAKICSESSYHLPRLQASTQNLNVNDTQFTTISQKLKKTYSFPHPNKTHPPPYPTFQSPKIFIHIDLSQGQRSTTGIPCARYGGITNELKDTSRQSGLHAHTWEAAVFLFWRKWVDTSPPKWSTVKGKTLLNKKTDLAPQGLMKIRFQITKLG